MARDDFSKQTLDVLAKRVGVRCSSPSCKKLTTGPRTESQHIINIGVGAHITAASSSGPRFDSSLTSEERQSPENGIWLCQNCAKLVDNDTVRYTADLLRGWKNHAEATALAEIEGRVEPQPVDLSAELELFYVNNQIKSERHDYTLQVRLTNRGLEPLGTFHVDLEMPSRVVERPDEKNNYVPDRSTEEIAFFRVASKTHWEIYPGDSKVVISVPYYMDSAIDRGIFFNPRVFGDLFERPVKAIFYRHGYQPILIERTFGEFQIF